MGHTGAMKIGFLHPGAMGESLAGTCQAGARMWAGQGRSVATAERAARAGLDDAGTVAALVAECETIVSICPPAAAVEVAAQVGSAGFAGTYVDANAIAPETSRRIAASFGAEVDYVDGSVIGPPASAAGLTRLYLSGSGADRVAELWSDTLVEPVVMAARVGAASAIKMAYASWTKIGAAMLMAVNALAEQEGVADVLHAEWERSQPGLAERSQATAAAIGPKAWRFVGEMDQIAAAYRADDLPGGFAQAGSEIYTRLADLKDAPVPDLATVLAALS